MYKITVKIICNYLFFPISNSAVKSKVWVETEDKKPYDIDLRLCASAEYVTWMYTGAKKGEKIVFSCEKEGIVDLIYQGNVLPQDLFNEELRPYFHFTPARGWVNDPNGLVYVNGKYHVFYQHNPYDVRWGNMHWGHSYSDDMFSWKDAGEALYPDENGTMFSGCAVYDKNNESGLGKNDLPPVLLYYTSAGGDNSASAGKPFTVCMAYSVDGGQTYVKYGENPVVPNIVYGNRDPKIIRFEKENKWIMILFLRGNDFAILSSGNLLVWKKESVITLPTMNECPDLFPIYGTDKWAILAGADFWGDKSVGKYVIGVFDGHEFIIENGPYPIDFGKEFYSLQTFYNDPKERRVLMGWRTKNFFIPDNDGMPFNGEYSVPTSLTPCYINGELRLARYPVEEFFELEGEILYSEEKTCYDAALVDAHVFDISAGRSFFAEISFVPENNLIMELNVAGEKIVYNLETQTLQCFDKNVKVPPENGDINLLVLRDVSSIELYAQNGKYPITGYFVPCGEGVKLNFYRGKAENFICKIKSVSDLFGKRK